MKHRIRLLLFLSKRPNFGKQRLFAINYDLCASCANKMPYFSLKYELVNYPLERRTASLCSPGSS
jgi:hypothetical protein